MGKRKRIPAALHSELTEYSSLIRALRTTNSLDVTSHITKPRPYSVQISFPPCTSVVSSPGLTVETPSNLSSRKRKRSSGSPSRPRRRDAWTRWPLLANDVYVPEWSLEDEIGILAAQALKLRPHPPLPVFPSRSSTSNSNDGDNYEDEDDEDNGDAPSYLSPLTNAASTYLSTILALLVAHTPNRPLSQQNRIEPIGWRAVLDMLSSCGDPSVANQKIITNVRTRMEAVYGPSTDDISGDLLAAQRIQLGIAAKEKSRARLSRPMEDLLSLAAPPAPRNVMAACHIQGKKERRKEN